MIDYDRKVSMECDIFNELKTNQRNFWFQPWHVRSLEVVTLIFTTRRKLNKLKTTFLKLMSLGKSLGNCNICICIADSLCYKAETNTAL